MCKDLLAKPHLQIRFQPNQGTIDIVNICITIIKHGVGLAIIMNPARPS